MTIKELYDWAMAHNREDYELSVADTDNLVEEVHTNMLYVSEKHGEVTIEMR